MEDHGEQPGVGRYRIGSVTDLTGIPPHTLRAWERRYGVTEPVRTDAGFRLYSEEDVGRLTLIKRLSDLGHAIGSIANLGLPELQERLARAEARGWRGGGASRTEASRPAGGILPVMLLDASVAAQLREAGGEATGLRIVASATSVEELRRPLAALPEEEAVVVLAALRQLGADPAGALRRLLDEPGVASVVVLHDFAPRKLLRRLAATGARLVQGHPGVEGLRRLVREAFERPSQVRRPPPPDPGNGARPPENPPRIFLEEDLGRLREVESAVDCECPNHLSGIISALVAFEEYALECESRDARDAALHAHLYRETGRARSIMEGALLHLCQEEGIEL